MEVSGQVISSQVPGGACFALRFLLQSKQAGVRTSLSQRVGIDIVRNPDNDYYIGATV